ncbi:ABC transporter ATP-binding protein [Phreatobacter cathodiphilus]|uniref:Microcin ABC transporter ATP-binding protein n=1 Tax=Phreatobacter cathodiphilus TaxID=1868589 RepID=A0A2S0N7J0_9HYPH|nr:ABC transporter ATP-binding protein [Phreatobacter cathodiphilus]AVO44095.1 microcin ABC transporter ATP-binding protein [Phreatobacter cathodiphilus]
MSAPILDIRNLTVELPKGADRRNAVEDVSFAVYPGEIVCVVGESGSGKSVSSHAVMGLLPKGQLKATGGQILLEGENVLEASASRLRDLRGTRMSMIFQEPMTALNPVVTCGEQIDEVLRIHTGLGATERKEKVLAVMDSVRLPDPAKMYDAYPHQLSGGQRQRIMIAQALVLDPVLLIADEPTTALDVTTQAQILKLIAEMQERRGTGVLFITHDFGVVAEIAHRVVVMQRGKVVETGTATEVLKNPQHPYTQMLINAVPTLTPPVREERTGELALETVKLCKVYGGGGFFQKKREVRAASDVEIRVRRGETLGIVGESGSGKSTVARCIARLITPTSGGIVVSNMDIANLPERQLRPHRKHCQIVFQDPYRSLNPRRSVGASIIEGPMNFGMSEADAIAKSRDLMKLVGLSPDALDRYPHQFSGGQRQRICIARALAMEPEILIADEAVSALDVSVQAQVLDLLDDVRKKFDLAVLFITHDLRVAAQICDRIAVMQNGVVVEHGKTADIFAAPQHPYTRALFDAAPGRNFQFARVA